VHLINLFFVLRLELYPSVNVIDDKSERQRVVPNINIQNDESNPDPCINVPSENDSKLQTRKNSGRKTGIEKRNTIVEVENVIKLTDIIRDEEQKTDLLNAQLKQALESIDRIKEKISIVENQIEEKNFLY